MGWFALLTNFVLFFYATTSTTEAQNEVPIIQMHPSSLLVPVGYNAVFECTIQHCPSTCDVHWFINHTTTADQEQQRQFENRNFSFSNEHDTTNNIFKGRLSVLSSVAVNNTQVCCVIQDGLTGSIKTSQATLLVLSGAKLPFNPSLTVAPYTLKNLASFSLRWSPPYLWPGRHINYFNVSVTNTSDLNISYHRVNASFDEVMVPLTLDFEYLSVVCTEFIFEINAVSSSGHLPSYKITEKYQPPPPEFNKTDIEVSVLFTSTAQPFVTMNIVLPAPVCPNQEANYTIIMEEIGGQTSHNSSQHYGLYHYMGPGTMSHIIDWNFRRNREYSAKVTVFILSYVTSHVLFFRQQVHKDETFIYKVLLGIVLFVAVFIVLSLVIVLVFVCLRKARQPPMKGTTGDDRTMVPNPIYDQAAGPEYETVIQTFAQMSETTVDVENSIPSPPTTGLLSGDKRQRILGESDNYTVMRRFDSLNGVCQNYERNGVPIQVPNQRYHLNTETRGPIKT